MRYVALASDYDGTLASAGRMDADTVAALERCRASGRQVIMVTGRELDDLAGVCPRLDLFTRIVAENGGLLYDPSTRRERLLGEAPPESLVRALRALAVTPLSVGRVVVATREPHDVTVLRAIRELGLEHEMIFNKGAVMVLPSGMNKATGLHAALTDLALSPHNIVGVGDAENDHAFLSACECGVAVANALPALKQRADLVTGRDHGAGVAELIDRLIDDDLRSIDLPLGRHDVPIGVSREGQIMLSPPRATMLVAGTDARVSEAMAEDILQQVIACGYQCCVVDPSADHDPGVPALTVGTPSRPPSVEEVCAVLRQPGTHCVANLAGIPPAARPSFYHQLSAALAGMRARVGRPHLVVVHGAEELLPRGGPPAASSSSDPTTGLMLVTTQPTMLASDVLASLDVVLATGDSPDRTMADVAELTQSSPPLPDNGRTDGRRGLIWWRVARTGREPRSMVWFTPRSPGDAWPDGAPPGVAWSRSQGRAGSS